MTLASVVACRFFSMHQVGTPLDGLRVGGMGQGGIVLWDVRPPGSFCGNVISLRGLPHGLAKGFRNHHALPDDGRVLVG